MPHSYTPIANELRHRFRDDLNHAEHLRDVENAFTFTVRGLLVQAFNNRLTFTDNDISLTPDKGFGFQLAPAIRDTIAFKAAARESDLLDIIAQFAETAAHRRHSLEKNDDTKRHEETSRSRSRQHH